MASTKAWRKDRITAAVDEETGLRVVDLPAVKGLKADVRDAIFAFEREHLGTVRAVIRMNKRAQAGKAVLDVTPARLTGIIPDALKAYFA